MVLLLMCCSLWLGLRRLSEAVVRGTSVREREFQLLLSEEQVPLAFRYSADRKNDE